MKTFKIFSIFTALAMTSFLSAQVKVPFRLEDDKEVFVKLKINDSQEELLFFFDTGATSSLIDKKAAERLGIKANQTQSVSGASGQKIYEFAIGQKVTIGDQIQLNNVNLVFDDMDRMKKAMGVEFDGIIGYDLLAEYMTELDFDQQIMTIYSNDSQPNLEGYKAHPFTWKPEIPIPHYELEFKLANNTTYKGTVLFDSGAGLVLLINSKFQQQNNILEQMPNNIISSSQDLTQKSDITVSTLESLKFLDYNFDQKMLTRVSTDKGGVNAMPGYLGILGAEIINRFNLVIDYANMTIHFKPNKLFDKAFSTHMSPFRLIEKDNQIVVNHVVETSDAAQKGIVEGDVILSINDQTITDVIEARKFFKEPNAKLKLKIQKADKTIQTKEIILNTLL